MTESVDFGIDDQISFGPFTLFPARRLLLKQGIPQKIGSRALEILVILIQQPVQFVAKDEIIARAWPDTFVDPSNLKVNI